MALAVVEFQQLLAGLAQQLGVRVERLVAQLGRLNQQELLAFITDAYPELVTPYLAATGEATAVWYDDQPATSGSEFVAQPAELTPTAQLGASARWAMLQRNPVAALQGSATRAVFSASRDTVIDNTVRERVRWARHASANACGFCRLLATRGAVYRSQANARKSHDHCHCLAVPDRDGTYSPPPYVAQWEKDYAAARSNGARTPSQIATAMDKAPSGRRQATPAQMPRGATPRPQSDSTGTVPPVKPPDARAATGDAEDRRPPPRVKGMLGPNTTDDFPAFSGWRAPVARSDIERFTVEDANIVLDGDGTGGHGYHRSGLGVKGDEFPPGWSSDDVVDLTNAVIDAPSDGMPGVRVDRFSLLGTYRQVTAVVRVRSDVGGGWRVATVHPYDEVRWRRERERLGE